MSAVVLDRVSKAFPATAKACHRVAALQDVSLTVDQGELLVVVGPSGSGKTTLLRIMAGLENPTSGSVWMDGREMSGVAPQLRDVSMVFQEHSLYPHMTVQENLAFGLKLRKASGDETARRVNGVARLLGIQALLARSPAALSGGERQRVALGRALILKPRVLLLDEPFSQLDAPLQAQMRRELASLHQQLAATMVYVTHDQMEAMGLASRLAVIKAGVIQQIGPPLELYRKPANVFVASFLGMPPINLLRGALISREERLFFEAGAPGLENPGLSFQVQFTQRAALAAHSGGVILGVRPEHLRIHLGSGPALSPGATLRAAIERVEQLGWETHVWLSRGPRYFVARAGADFEGSPGEEAQVTIEMAEAHFFCTEGGKRVC